MLFKVSNFDFSNKNGFLKWSNYGSKLWKLRPFWKLEINKILQGFSHLGNAIYQNWTHDFQNVKPLIYKQNGKLSSLIMGLDFSSLDHFHNNE
jgi:hypothetical protein